MSNIKDYAVQLVHVQPNDVVLLHVSEDLSFDDLQSIQYEIQQAFPENKILVANEHILKKITIFRADDILKSDLISDALDPEHNWLQSSPTLKIESNSTGGYVAKYNGSEIYDVLY